MKISLNLAKGLSAEELRELEHQVKSSILAKQLRKQINVFSENHPTLHIVYCPEACGINVTETMRLVGEILEWPPQTKTYQIVIAGY